MPADSAHHPEINHERGTWLDPQAGKIVSQADVIARAAQAQAVLLGETHDIPEIHRWQLHVTVALHARVPDLAVGYEMFPRRVQPVLDDWVAGKLTTEEFLSDVAWFDVWGFDPELYLPLFHFCRQHRVKMLALNCERTLVRRVRLEGWAAIPEQDRDGLTPAKFATEGYRKYLSDLMSGMGDGAPREISDGFINAQQTWDRAFAVNIAKALAAKQASLVVGIIGRGHLEFGHGTPFQLRDLGIETISVLLPAGQDEWARNAKPGIGDAIFKLDRPEGRQPRGLKLGITWEGKSLKIAEVAADSPGEALGLKSGDILRGMVGTELTTQADFMAVFRRFQSGSMVPLAIERNGARIEMSLPIPHQKPFGS